MTWWVAGAAVVGGIGGAMISGNAAEDAANVQAGAANHAADLSDKQYQQNRTDAQPWRDAGTVALGQIGKGTATGGDFNRDFTAADFQRDPGYQFRQSEGMAGVEGSAAARGGLLNGGTLRALDRYNQEFASGEYSNAYNRFNADRDRRFNRLSSLAGIGQTATRDVASQGMQNASSMAEYGMQGANARASGYVGQANAIGSGINTLGNIAQGYAAQNRNSGQSSYTGSRGYTGTNDGYTGGNATNWFLTNGSSGD